MSMHFMIVCHSFQQVASGEKPFLLEIVHRLVKVSTTLQDAPVLSMWKALRNVMSFAWFLRKMSSIVFGLLGFATNTLKTWNASN